MVDPELLVLAGGLGVRLSKRSGGNVPKCALPISEGKTALDLTLEQLKDNSLSATFSAREYYHWYDSRITPPHSMLWQIHGGIVEAVTQRNHRILTIAPDTIANLSFIPDMIRSHIPGTITWAVANNDLPLCEAYRGCSVIDGAIVGRDNNSFVRSPYLIIEPNLIRQFANINHNETVEGENLFYDVLPRIEQYNLERIRLGQKSILNAFIMPKPFFDFGDLDKYQFALANLDKIMRGHNKPISPSQLIPIYNQSGELIGEKSREKVHIDGSWHKGVQLDIHYNDSLLTQTRSDDVDISRNMIDQSLATQAIVEDNLDPIQTLSRGYSDEVSGPYSIKDLELVASNVPIQKHYNQQPTVINNEFVTLYRVRTTTKQLPKHTNRKVSGFQWSPLTSLKARLFANPQSLTKTFAMWLRGYI